MTFDSGHEMWKSSSIWSSGITQLSKRTFVSLWDWEQSRELAFFLIRHCFLLINVLPSLTETQWSLSDWSVSLGTEWVACSVPDHIPSNNELIWGGADWWNTLEAKPHRFSPHCPLEPSIVCLSLPFCFNSLSDTVSSFIFSDPSASSSWFDLI